MGKDFFRLVQLAIASGALMIPGVVLASDEGGRAPVPPAVSGASAAPPVVQSVRLDKGGLTIQFSKPLKTPEVVDPSRFRLTFAYYSKGRPGDYSYYHEYYGSKRSVTTYENVGQRSLSGRIESVGADKVRIPASRALSLSSICSEISKASPTELRAGLYLHYSSQGTAPQIETADGASLASIAPYWLTKDDATVRAGSFQGRPIPVTVSCR